MSRGPHLPPMHRARVEAHRVGRWTVPACAVEIPAVSVDHARELAVREAHRRADVPHWRPFVRESMAHATAEPVDGAAVDPQVERHEQLELGRAA